MVIYSDPSLSPGLVYINQGAVMISDTVNIENPVSPPLPGVGHKLTTLGADGQVGFFSTLADSSISGEQTFIGPTPDS